MQIFDRLCDWQKQRQQMRVKNLFLGFVPTMGALHAGHQALMEKSQKENDHTLVSIFVNPTQFNNPKDLSSYPRQLESDLKILENTGVSYVLLPQYEEIYADNYRFRVCENSLSQKLCGAYREGHFDGVLTVVLKLLQLAQADRAYFGEKDFQQYLLISQMAQNFFLSTEICAVPTVREANGLAMSSRNNLLTQEERQKASMIYKLLQSSLSLAEIQRELEQEGFQVEYLTEWNERRFIAAYLGSVRLIDNVPLSQAMAYIEVEKSMETEQ